jgi:oligopeptide/dipeptide ABC transporter ATP-binding protein
MAMLLITHDLGVVAEVAARVLVMYGGQVVERADVKDLFARPAHPYTQGLLRAMPRVGQGLARLETIAGTVPPPTRWPSGCRFHDRCPLVFDRCNTDAPLLPDTPHAARCHLAPSGVAS